MTQVLQLPIIQKSILLYFDLEFDIAMQRYRYRKKAKTKSIIKMNQTAIYDNIPAFALQDVFLVFQLLFLSFAI